MNPSTPYTVGEVAELTGFSVRTRSVEGVELAQFIPFPPGAPQYRSHGPQAAIHAFHILLQVAEGAFAVANAIIAFDKAWEVVKPKLSGKSSVEASATLYGEDGKPIKSQKGRR